MITSLREAINFLTEFHSPLKIDPHLPLDKISQGLPDTLAEFYRCLGSLIALTGDSGINPPFGTQDFLLSPPGPVNPKERFIIADEHQSVCQWVVDPSPPYPVFCNAQSVFDGEDERFDPVEDTLDSFLITFSLSEAAMSPPHVECVNTNQLDDAFLEQPSKLWIGAPYVSRDNKRDFYYFSSQGAIVMESETGIWIASYKNNLTEIINPDAPPPPIKPKPRIEELPPLSEEEDQTAMSIFRSDGRIRSTYWLRDSRECSLMEANVLMEDILKRLFWKDR